MTKDEIEAALNKLEEPLWLNGGRSVPLIIRELLGVKHYETIRAALQSQLTKNDENVTCGNLSNADGRQAALESIDRLDGWLSELKGMIEAPQELLLINRPSILADINCAIKDMRVNGACIRAALQSALDAKQSNADTVDLDALKEKMISDFEEEKESELSRGYELGLCHAVDYLAQNYNITRKTK